MNEASNEKNSALIAYEPPSIQSYSEEDLRREYPEVFTALSRIAFSDVWNPNAPA